MHHVDTFRLGWLAWSGHQVIVTVTDRSTPMAGADRRWSASWVADMEPVSDAPEELRFPIGGLRERSYMFRRYMYVELY